MTRTVANRTKKSTKVLESAEFGRLKSLLHALNRRFLWPCTAQVGELRQVAARSRCDAERGREFGSAQMSCLGDRVESSARDVGN